MSFHAIDRRPLVSPSSSSSLSSATQTLLEDPLAFFSRSAVAAPPARPQRDAASSSFSSSSSSPRAPYSSNQPSSSPSSSASSVSLLDEVSASHPAPVPSFSYTSASNSASSSFSSLPSAYASAFSGYTPSHPLAQAVSIAESPLQLARGSSQPRNPAPDYSSLSSGPVASSSSRRRSSAPPPAEASLPAPPAPLALPVTHPLSQMSSLSRGSYGSFSAPNCPHIVTRLMIPIYLFLSVMTVIVYSVANQRCPSSASQRPDHGWCCVEQPFTRYLSIITFVIHAVLLTWLLQMYHTPYLTFFPRHNRTLIMVAFFLRAAFLVFVWMLYFLILSLNLISTLPEQAACASTFADRSLFFPAAVLNIACCLFVKVMLGLMGKSIWKYWELRHLTPEELLHYEQQLEEGRQYGLTREQVEVLTRVMLTCHDGVVTGEQCPDCGYSARYQPPSLAHVLGEKIAPKINAVNAYIQRRRQGQADEMFSGLQVHGEPADEQQEQQSADAPSRALSPLSPPADDSVAPASPAPYPFPLEHQPSSSSLDLSAPKSRATLTAHGGLPSMTCGICLEDYRVHERVMILPCRHHGHIDCLTGDHRVLTRSGWQSITRMEVGDEVLSFNVATYAQEWKRVTNVECHAVDPANAADDLFRMQGRGMDVIATRNHRMLLARLSPRHANGLQQGTAVGYETVDELLRLSYSSSSVNAFAHNGSRAVVRAGANVQPDVKVVIPGLEQVCDWWWQQDRQLGFVQFLGFWLGDGSLDVQGGYVCINQKKEAGKQWLEQLLHRVFPRWWNSAKPSAPGTVAYYIRCPPLYAYLRKMAIGPLGYNPRDPQQLRTYPHFTKDEKLAAEELKWDYMEDNNHGGVSTWTEDEMLAELCVAAEMEGVEEMAATVEAEASAATRAAEAMEEEDDAAPSPARRASVSAATTASSTSQPAADERRFSFSSDHEKGKEGKESPASLQPMDSEKPALLEGDDEVVPAVEAVQGDSEEEPPQEVRKMRLAGHTVWWHGGWWIIDGHWFHLKRWLGEHNVANVYSRLSRQQAAALLEGLCRAGGAGNLIQHDDNNEPAGVWKCSSSSFPLIDQLMLIAQLAGAAVSLQLQTKAGEARSIDGRRVSFSVEHWSLQMSFSKPARLPMLTALLAQPVSVSDNVPGRGYYQYEDDEKVYCIQVQDNSNFLTQRLASTRLTAGGVGERAHSVFVGNCLMGWLNGHRSCPTCRSSVVKIREDAQPRRRQEGDWRDFD